MRSATDSRCRGGSRSGAAATSGTGGRDVGRVACGSDGFGGRLQLPLLVLKQGELFLEMPLLDLQRLEGRCRLVLMVEGLLRCGGWELSQCHGRGVGRVVVLVR